MWCIADDGRTSKYKPTASEERPRRCKSGFTCKCQPQCIMHCQCQRESRARTTSSWVKVPLWSASASWNRRRACQLMRFYSYLRPIGWVVMFSILEVLRTLQPRPHVDPTSKALSIVIQNRSLNIADLTTPH